MKNGTVITKVPTDHEVEVAAYLEPGTYASVIAVLNNGSAGGGGCGCEAGLGLVGLLALASLMATRKH